MKHFTTNLYPEIEETIKGLVLENIPENRKKTLNPLIDFIQAKLAKSEPVDLNFICTHNSRRSHLSQVWAQALTYYYQVENVTCYSGGTEATALFPMVAETLKKQGFQIQILSQENNPVYAIKYAENTLPIIGFSKRFDNDFNPKSGFAAIMTCDSAHEACPFVSGADMRIPITYEDPKAFDKTPQQHEMYLERSLQIATELKYVFSAIK